MKLESFPGEPVQQTGELKPVKMTEPKPGVYVFDLGQNFAGFARLKVRGPAGTRVVLRFAEMLNPDGTIYTANLGAAWATDTYVLKGDGEEIWQPRFTYHGFRYVEVTGYPGRPTADAVTGVAVNSNCPLTGSFECSSPMVNQLYRNIVWTQRANFMSVPTDCPQRDERLGWTGDAETFVRAATYNADVAAFFTKWLVDLRRRPGAGGRFSRRGPARRLRRRRGGLGRRRHGLPHDHLSRLQRPAAAGETLPGHGPLGRVLPARTARTCCGRPRAGAIGSRSRPTRPRTCWPRPGSPRARA